MIIDAHLHCTGRENTTDVLRTLDEAGIDTGVLLAPFLGDGYSLNDAASLRRANEHLSRLVRHHPDRLIGFAVVDPRDPAAPQDLRYAVEDLGLRGCKMVPTGWYPYEERVQPVFAVANELALPLLFHSGIFIDGRSGRFCRPTYFEALRDHPRTRVALAHMGWPWTDEALAVALIDRIHGIPYEQAQFRLDISFGPPPAYRREVLARMLEVLGAGALQFGSDCFLPCSGAHVMERRQWVIDLMDELELGADTRHRLWCGTAAAWLGLKLEAEAPPMALARPHGLPRRNAHDEDSTGGGGAAHASVPRPWRPICC
ncbi:amidohydrolase family protein [Roseateles sp. SL47]|uniref:amidohydrolase family protein n=1 Tax=Roseateles sp. SL47 TaxID=2995138 RepID=UPI00226F1445|nr:amidohydrolase family protein [Roseateles sp. SL47]WAC72189.1 amidohydrolase family protein [Roseateles sp. SL47]